MSEDQNEIITKAEHEAAIAKLHNEFGCELRDPNGTIWEQAARLQKENEELRARVEELKSLARAVTVVDFELVTCEDVGEEYWFDARARLLKGGTNGD